MTIILIPSGLVSFFYQTMLYGIRMFRFRNMVKCQFNTDYNIHCEIRNHTSFFLKVLKKRKDFKVILMSATIDAEKISEYFDKCPMIHIEGLAYPVEDIYLEDILEATKFQLPEAKSNTFNKRQPKWMKYATKNLKNRDAKEIEKQVQYRAEISMFIYTSVGTKAYIHILRKT